MIISKLSVVTIAYSDPEALVKTIRSVDSQSVAVWEHIVIASKVAGIEALATQYEAYYRVFVIDQDKSIYNAMNIGMSIATGEAVLYMNSGDVFFDQNSVLLLSSHFVAGKCLIARTVQSYKDLFYVRPGLKRLSDLRLTPGHQGFVAPLPEKTYNRIFYNESNKISADSEWMKENLKRFDGFILPNVVAQFELGGLSNYPSFRALSFSLQSNKKIEALKIIIKIFVFQVLGDRQYYKFVSILKRYDALERDSSVSST